MARIRTIKPEFWYDEKIGKLSMPARLLFIGLWNFADDAGVVRGHPIYLRSNIFPYDDVSKADIEGWIKEISDQNIITVYSVHGESFIKINNFLKHQVINRPSKTRNPSKPDSPTVPDYEESDGIETQSMSNRHESLNNDDELNDTSSVLTEPCTDTHGVLTEYSRSAHGLEREKEKGKGRDTTRDMDSRKRGVGGNPSSDIEAETTAPSASPPALVALTGDGDTSERTDPPVKNPQPAKPKDQCPHDEIVMLYHEILPELPKVTHWNGDGKKSLAKRWREDKARQKIDWWEAYFQRVANSDFLTGRKTDWRASLVWLVAPKNMDKVLNGQYDNHDPPIAASGTRRYPARFVNNVNAAIEFIKMGEDQ